MGDLNVNTGGGNSFVEDTGNIVVKRKPTIHVEGTSTQDLLEASKTYQEDRIPPAGNPELAGSNPNADTSTPRTNPKSKEGLFAKNLSQNINNLSAKQLALLKEGNPALTKNQAKEMLIFAWNHPDAAVDPAVKQLIDEMSQNAEQKSEEELGLSHQDPPSPDTAFADAEINDNNDTNFEALARNNAPTTEDANQMILAHYHPEYEEALSPELQSLLQATENAAEQETGLEDGTPENWQFSADSSQFDAEVSNSYDSAFRRAVNDAPSADKAMLTYLHYNPDADVPDKDRLLALLNQLNGEAMQDAQSSFNLPKNFPILAGSSYNTMLKDEFSHQFESKVLNFSPPLTPSQMQALLNSKGLNGSNLPPELKAIFDQLQKETFAEIANRFGIPQEWETQVIENLEESEETDQTEESGSTGGTENTSNTNNLSPFQRITRRNLHTNNVTFNTTSLTDSFDMGTTRNAINLYQEAYDHVNNWTKDYLTEGEYTLNQNIIGGVSAALSHLREMLYATEGAQVEAQNKNAIAQQEGAKSQNIISDEKRAKAKEDQDKEWAFYKFLEAVLPGFLAKLVEDAVKFVFWVLDTITGGAITMICEACHCKPISENPLESMGIVNHETAKTLDLVAQILVIIIEMVASTIIAQPELVAAEVAEMTADITATVGEKVAEEAVKLAMEEAAKVAAKQGIKDVVDATGKDITKEVTKQAIQKLSKSEVKAIEKALKETLKEAVQESLEGTTKEAVKEGVEKSSKEFVKKVVQRALKEEGFEVGKTGAQAAMERVSNFVESVLDKMRNLLKMSKDSEIEDDLIRSFTKNAKKLAAKNATGNIAGKFGAVQLVKDVVGGSIQAIGNGIEAGMKFQQAQLHLELAQLDAQLAELTTDLQVLKKGLQQLLETTKSTTEWIGRINKDQIQTWKTLSIHFVA